MGLYYWAHRNRDPHAARKDPRVWDFTASPGQGHTTALLPQSWGTRRRLRAGLAGYGTAFVWLRSARSRAYGRGGGFGRQRELDRERRALAFAGALWADPATVELDQALHDRSPMPRPS